MRDYFDQLTLDVPKKPCALTTHGTFIPDGYEYWAVCDCSWEGPRVASGPEAAGTWQVHTEGRDQT